MADGEETTSGRGQFGTRVAQLEGKVAALEAKMEGIEEAQAKLLAAVDPDELEWIWENFRELTEVLSNVRRTVGLPPLAEFSGSKERRRKAERIERIAREAEAAG